MRNNSVSVGRALFVFYRFIFLSRSRREVGRYRPKFVLSVWLPLFRIYSHLSTLKYTEIIFKKVPLVLYRRFCTIVGCTKVDLGTYEVLRGIFKTLFCGSPPIYIYTFRRAIVPTEKRFLWCCLSHKHLFDSACRATTVFLFFANNNLVCYNEYIFFFVCLSSSFK